jgi:hypothetical protein
MPIVELILLLCFAASFLMLALVVVSYKYFRSYTRERFAFRVFLLIASLSGSVIFLLLSGKSKLALFISAIASIFGIEGVDFEPSFSDKLLAVVLLFSLMYFATRLHKNWPGAISVREHEARLAGEKPTVVIGAIAAVANIAGKVELQPYESAKAAPHNVGLTFAPADTRAWHVWVT